MFKTPILMLKMKFFWLIFRGKFEQKTQNSIFLKNHWRLKNIKKAMIVKNIIAEDMAFTKSIFDNFEEVIAKKRFSSFSTFWNFCPTTERGWGREKSGVVKSQSFCDSLLPQFGLTCIPGSYLDDLNAPICVTHQVAFEKFKQ